MAVDPAAVMEAVRRTVLAAIDTAETAKHLEERPWPFFLALVIGVVAVLWTSYVHAAWAGARRERDLYKQLLQREQERSAELKRERDGAREETKEVRSEHMEDLVRLSAAAEGLVRMRDDYRKLKAELHRNQGGE